MIAAALPPTLHPFLAAVAARWASRGGWTGRTATAAGILVGIPTTMPRLHHVLLAIAMIAAAPIAFAVAWALIELHRLIHS